MRKYLTKRKVIKTFDDACGLVYAALEDGSEVVLQIPPEETWGKNDSCTLRELTDTDKTLYVLFTDDMKFVVVSEDRLDEFEPATSLS